MFGGAPPPPLPPPPHGRLGRRRAPAAVPAAGSAEAAAPSLSADASFGRGGLVKLATLEAAYRSGEPGLQLQAVELFGQLFEEQPFPTVINAGFLKLADWFRTTQQLGPLPHLPRFRAISRPPAKAPNCRRSRQVHLVCAGVHRTSSQGACVAVSRCARRYLVGYPALPVPRSRSEQSGLHRTLGCVGFTMAERVNIQQK
ncbi:MAG: hypothetical protein BJ554DRAFT_6879 [Olpidium bornovanus]|uniref:Uncharacterized protein n=1 Tax=Olpidium bornovanus TaxID=278681 RepID=A0A8H8DKD7_9FUNG|nr:MAG: hypothetical protein BJ554DRAFT_6879 [Olpidium bornovanus]